MMKRLLFAFLLLMICTGSLSAQRRPRVYTVGDPAYWISGGIAGFTGNGVNDGPTASTWDFGNSTNWQYRASLEKAFGGGSSFGIAGTYSRVPFTYRADLLKPLPANETGSRCSSCDAHLDMTTLVATFHFGAGYGFHQVIELNAGIVAYQRLRTEPGGATLAPAGGNIDPIFSIGYGIGYGLSDRTQIDFVPDYAIAIHERGGLPNGVSNTNNMRSLRISVRMGFGSRAAAR